MKTGDKVVCIKGDEWTGPDEAPRPSNGEIYTIISTEYSFGGLYLTLSGLRQDMAYYSSHFRLTDTTFGEVVCEILEKQIEHDKVLA